MLPSSAQNAFIKGETENLQQGNIAASAERNLLSLHNCSFCSFHLMINYDGLIQLLCRLPGHDVLAVVLTVESESGTRGITL